MDRLYRIITDVTLTTPLPPPYKLLYRFENMTEELKVKKKFSVFANYIYVYISCMLEWWLYFQLTYNINLSYNMQLAGASMSLSY